MRFRNAALSGSHSSEAAGFAGGAVTLVSYGPEFESQAIENIEEKIVLDSLQAVGE